MVKEFLDYFLNQRKGKKGYQIIGLKRIIPFFLTILVSVVSLLIFHYTGNIVAGLLILVCIALILFQNKGIDKRLMENLKSFVNKEKEEIKYWLRSKKGFSKGEHYKELAKLILDTETPKKVQFNINSFLILLIPIWSAMVGASIKESTDYMYALLFFAALFTFLGAMINLLIKGGISLFETNNHKIKRIYNTLMEISIEESIKETTQNTKNG